MVIRTKSEASVNRSTLVRTGTAEWEDAPEEFTRRSTIMTVYGDTGSGRTTLALTAPGPIALIHAAEKIDGIVQKFSRDKKIRVHNFGAVFRGGDESEIAAQAMEVWRKFESAYYDAYGWARTIVIDTHTELWELIRIAYFGDLKPSTGRVDANYGPVNARWRSLLKHYRQQEGTNLILLGQTKDEYKSKKTATGKDGMGERTGNTIHAGQKEVLIGSDVVVRTRINVKEGEFSSVIEKPWMNGPMLGFECDAEMSNFPVIMGLITDTDAEEWGG